MNTDKRNKKYILPVLWMILIFTLSSFPGNTYPSFLSENFSWLAHFIEYAVLGFLWYRALNKRIILVLVICILFSISDEIHQLFVPLRECSIIDIIVDIFGIIFGLIIERVRGHSSHSV